MAAPEQPNASQSLWRAIKKFDKQKISAPMALRNAIGIAAPLAIGVAIGSPVASTLAATGALNVSFSDGSDGYAQRAGRMLTAAIVCSAAIVIGALAGHNGAIAVAVVTGWALIAGLLVSVSTTAGDIGLISLVTVVVFTARPMTLDDAVFSGLLALAGGILQTSLSLAFWPVRQDEPERRAIADVYDELARLASISISASEAPPATSVFVQAHEALDQPAGFRSIAIERLLTLLSQAERSRLALLALSRLRVRLAREPETGADTETVDRARELSTKILSSIAEALRSGRQVAVAPESLQQLSRLIASYRDTHSERASATADALSQDALYQIDALAGQLRAAMDLAAYATPMGKAVFERREAGTPWTLRLAGSIATLRANLTFDSAAFRHAIRLSVCVGVGDTISRMVDWERSYWLPMTIAIILKPDFTSTFSRGVLRLVGTFLGLAIATVLSHTLRLSAAVDVMLVAIFAFLLRCFGPANYGVFVIALSALVVFLFSLSGVPPNEVVSTRAINTAIGGLLAVVTYAAWPTWEWSQVPEAVAKLLDAYRQYFHIIRKSYIDPDQDHSAELDRERQAVRLARSNLEASAERFESEPRATAEAISLLNAFMANSHRLVHAMMALEAGLTRSHPVPARPEFRLFANDLETTLHSLSALLRGSPLHAGDLPDLRARYNALVHSGDNVTERYALVNVESDRVTNSLNTLAEQILRWRVGQSDT